jgi:outer membrane protein OmpA-like peptidoglycan-associated protein
MKTMTVALVLVAAIGCSKDKAKTAKTTPDDPKPDVAEKPSVTPDKVTTDEQVSPGLAISSDILKLCGITAIKNANPKFDYDQDELTEDDRTVLGQIATCLTTGPLKGKTVSLIGRADPRGTEEYNLGLGSRRSHSVGQYLGRLGVAQTQLGVTTRGAIDATGTDEAGWKEDRRVDIQLMNPEG